MLKIEEPESDLSRIKKLKLRLLDKSRSNGFLGRYVFIHITTKPIYFASYNLLKQHMKYYIKYYMKYYIQAETKHAGGKFLPFS